MNIAGKIGVNRLPAAVVIAVAIGAVVAQAPWSQIQPRLQADELTVDSGAVMPRRITLPGDAIVEKTGIDPLLPLALGNIVSVAACGTVKSMRCWARDTENVIPGIADSRAQVSPASNNCG